MSRASGHGAPTFVMKTRLFVCTILLFFVPGNGFAWGGGRREDKKHQRVWAAFAGDLSRADCRMDSLSDTATVTLPMGQVVSKEEYRMACDGSMRDSTVGETSVVTRQLVTVDKSSFSVEATVVTEAISPKSGDKREITYPAAFFVDVDLKSDQVSHVRIYAQNMALLAARGYSMVPDGNYGPVIRLA